MEIHNYNLEYEKGEHINYPDYYVWECAKCGNQCTTTENIKPCQSQNEADCYCVPVRAITMQNKE